jgi:hypothetical protein
MQCSNHKHKTRQGKKITVSTRDIFGAGSLMGARTPEIRSKTLEKIDPPRLDGLCHLLTLMAGRFANVFLEARTQ